MTEWQGIETLEDPWTPFLARSEGIYHGVEFVAVRVPSQYPGGQEHYIALVSGRRIPDHCIQEWMPRVDPLARNALMFKAHNIQPKENGQ